MIRNMDDSCYGKLSVEKADEKFFRVNGDTHSIHFELKDICIFATRGTMYEGIVSGVDLDEQIVYMDDIKIPVKKCEFFARF